MITEDAQELLHYLNQLSSYRRNFPYDEIGAALSQSMKGMFKNPNYISSLKGRETYVQPIGNIEGIPPPWVNGKPSGMVPRSRAQLVSKKILEKEPVIYLSCDGGLYNPVDYIHKTPIIRQSAVIQAPMLTSPVVNVKSSIMDFNPNVIENPSEQMTVGEFQSMKCMVDQIYESRRDCDQGKCPYSNCPIKKIDLKPITKIVDKGDVKVVGYLDRPICANYLRIYTRKNVDPRNIEAYKAYKRLLNTAKKHGVTLLSVKQSSGQKALINTVIDFLAGRPFTTNSMLIKPIIDFINDNQTFIKKLSLDPSISKKYDLNTTEDLIRFLNEYWNNGTLKYNLIDYSLLKDLLDGFEYRSNAFMLQDQFLARNFPGIDFNFFYVGYGDNWGRVEYVNASPDFAAEQYYVQSAIGCFYPFIIKIAHDKAVISSKLIRVAQRKLFQLGLNKPTLKKRNK